ncbi:RNA 2',3'-cyclic phosphodiesterase [Verrucomicrobiota bacterium sgz303538]
MSKRLFIGLEVPPSCAEELVSLDPGVDGVHWLAAEQMYIAMSLEWWLNPEEEERLCDALEQVHVLPFFLPIQGIGTFGRPPSIVVSVGIGNGHPHFFALHRHIQDAVIHAQLEPDLRPYHPHVTIALAEETPKAKFQKFLREEADTEFCMWKVTNFALFSKQDSAEGSTYTVERRFPGS